MLSKFEADNLFLFYYSTKKIRHDILCKLSANQMIHMKCHALIMIDFDILSTLLVAGIVIKKAMCSEAQYSCELNFIVI